MSTAALFPSDARKKFVDLTGSRYDGMVRRLAAKKPAILVPFSKERFRAYVLEQFMGDQYDGAIECRWCLRMITLEECAFDHSVPLERGGSPDLSNLDAPCAEDNARKGIMLPDEYRRLLAFLERELPFARVDILKRLQEHPRLLAKHRYDEFAIREIKAKGQWPKKAKKSKPPLQQAIDDKF